MASDAGRQLRAASKAIQAATKSEMRRGGNKVRKELHTAAASATGGDRVYSGVGGAKLAVMVSTVQGRRSTTLTLKPQRKSAGQWTWANTGTKGGARRAKRRNGTRYVMNHPGTDGRGAWDGTVDVELPKLVADLKKSIQGAVR